MRRPVISSSSFHGAMKQDRIRERIDYLAGDGHSPLSISVVRYGWDRSLFSFRFFI